MRFKKKKGSLSLSMNAIVIIILAMAMIGVGLFVIRSVGQRVAHIPDTKTWVQLADADNPIVFYNDKENIKPGKRATVYVSLYNTEVSKGNASLRLVEPCSGISNLFDTSSLVENVNDPKKPYALAPRELEGRTRSEYVMLLKVNPGSEITGTAVCTFMDENGHTKDLVFEVSG